MVFWGQKATHRGKNNEQRWCVMIKNFLTQKRKDFFSVVGSLFEGETRLLNWDKEGIKLYYFSGNLHA